MEFKKKLTEVWNRMGNSMENGRELLVKGTGFQQLGSLGAHGPSLNTISMANNNGLFFPSFRKSAFLMLLPQANRKCVYDDMLCDLL